MGGEVRAIARLITMLENHAPGAEAVLARIFPATGRARVVGITGAPGVGKSTLVDGLVGTLRQSGLTVAVLAVDPSSPYTGGALLGDRIRMQHHMGDSGVFVRSMSARGMLGGLAPSAHAAVHVLDAAGFDVILLETVGVGQSELEVAKAADSVVVVVTPDMGDAIQTLKAGVLEVGDLFVMNKADLARAEDAVTVLRHALPGRVTADWQPPVLEVVARDGTGVPALWQHVLAQFHVLEETGNLASRRDERLRQEVVSAAGLALRTDVLNALVTSRRFTQLIDDVRSRQLDPLTAGRLAVAPVRAALEAQG